MRFRNVARLQRRPFAVVFVVCAVAMAVVSHGLAGPARRVDSHAADDLVRQLGNDSFLMREEAERLLQRLGSEAIPSLRDASDDSDLEVRIRARRLLRSIEWQHQQRILEQFVTAFDPELAQQLAGWTRYSELVGDDADARRLFFEMYEAEPVLMSLCDRSIPQRTTALQRRSIELQPRAGRPATTRGTSAATTATLLFLTLDPTVHAEATLESSLSRLIRESAFLRAATSGDDPPARRLLSAWVANAANIAATRRMTLGAKFNLTASLEPALELVQTRAFGSSLQPAILIVARFGDGRHVEPLERLLDNTTLLSERQRGDDDSFTCEVRDVALVALIHIIGKHPREFGFEELRPNPDSLYAPNTAGFDSAEKRDRAIRRWRLWQTLQRAEFREVDENAVEGYAL